MVGSREFTCSEKERELESETAPVAETLHCLLLELKHVASWLAADQAPDQGIITRQAF